MIWLVRFNTYLFLGCILAYFATSTALGDLSTASTAPFYSAASIVNAATQTAGYLAPNTIATIYGTNLSWTTGAVAVGDLNSGRLPTSLEGVTVYVNGLTSNLFFVSPGQINFLIPYELLTSSITVYVARQGVAGPPAKIPFAATAPGFFEWNGNFAVAEHANGTIISSSAPAQPGEIVVLFAAGMGRTIPDISSGQSVSRPTSIFYASQLQILLNGDPCPSSSIRYAGLTPGFAGLYQINLRLPDVLPPDPTIQIVIGTQASPPWVQLSTQ
jgi:uncharacterized protein (TIGR03437 family)